MFIDQKLSKQLCYNFIVNNGIAWHDWIAPVNEKRFVKTRFYQFAYILADEGVILGGRRYGKTHIFRYKCSQNMLREKGRLESLITSYRRHHTVLLFENVVDIFENLKYFKRMLKTGDTRGSVKRDVVLELKLASGHTLYGVAASDNVRVPHIKGLSPRYKYGEEFQDYPETAYKILISTVDPKLCHEFYFGVADGRRDTPFYNLNERSKSFIRNKFIFSRRSDPNFKLKDLIKLEEEYAGDVDGFKNEVDAEWGSAKAGVWNMDMIMRSTAAQDISHDAKIMREIVITPDSLYSMADMEWMLLKELKLLPDVEDCAFGIDVGDVEATIILPYQKVKNKWYCSNIIALKNRITVSQAKDIIGILIKIFRPSFIGIDITNSPALADELKLANPLLSDYIYKVHFASKIQYGEQYVTDEEEASRLSKQLNKHIRAGDKIELTEKAKQFGTRIFSNLLQNSQIYFYFTSSIFEEFSSEVTTQSGEGYRIITPRNVHIPEACRCFAIGWWLQFGESLDIINSQVMNEENKYLPLPVSTGICGHQSYSEDVTNHPDMMASFEKILGFKNRILQ